MNNRSQTDFNLKNFPCQLLGLFSILPESQAAERQGWGSSVLSTVSVQASPSVFPSSLHYISFSITESMHSLIPGIFYSLAAEALLQVVNTFLGHFPASHTILLFYILHNHFGSWWKSQAFLHKYMNMQNICTILLGIQRPPQLIHTPPIRLLVAEWVQFLRVNNRCCVNLF